LTAAPTAGTQQQCEQFHVYIRRRRLNRDFFLCAGTTTKPDGASDIVAGKVWPVLTMVVAELAVNLLLLIRHTLSVGVRVQVEV